MFSRGFLVLLILVVVGDKGCVLSKPCLGSLMNWFGLDDSSEDKPTKPSAPAIPPKIVVYLTPVADTNSVQAAIQAAPNGAYYLLPSLLPLGQGSPTTTTTAAPPPAPVVAAPVAAPAAAPAAVPAAAAPAAAAPAAAGAATPAPAAAGKK